MILPNIDDVIGGRGGFLDRVDSGFQIGDQDLALFVGDTVQIAGAVLDLGDTEMHAAQGRTIRAFLDEPQGRLYVVGEHEFRRLIAIQLDDPLGFIDDIARAGYLRHHIRA